jgi:hypothetical protein
VGRARPFRRGTVLACAPPRRRRVGRFAVSGPTLRRHQHSPPVVAALMYGSHEHAGVRQPPGACWAPGAGRRVAVRFRCRFPRTRQPEGVGASLHRFTALASGMIDAARALAKPGARIAMFELPKWSGTALAPPRYLVCARSGPLLPTRILSPRGWPATHRAVDLGCEPAADEPRCVTPAICSENVISADACSTISDD